ncbi:TetR/AcrR family transcriptional regulator [Actinokineospora sp. NBRC 105648]|uniref:TetR/AcrR family transcriptional regulator n=1 Tax=Actinokineospora sp. NBRC 105648 TaxID=3032206 RepID=UPI0024A18EC6|nr:TetR/AcrR family transcriptional regulator [Actinokineospora sp. NBRC 105648]GLZ37299.1 hypothetical protein Acsp05_09240 [Actinokineospora sp. NBRC 105648]
MGDEELAALPLRARKKALTRASIVAAAERLFGERGFDNVTVAEIADAANVSVKTLFVYFRSKEDLVLTDTGLIDALLSALRARPAETTHAEAVARMLLDLLARDSPAAGQWVEGFDRGREESEALRSGLLRRWAEYEDTVTAHLAAEAGVPATPDMRLHAIALVGIVRTLVAPEIRALVGSLGPAEATAALRDWLLVATRPAPARA